MNIRLSYISGFWCEDRLRTEREAELSIVIAVYPASGQAERLMAFTAPLLCV